MKNIRRGLLATTMLVGASMTATPAFAQSNSVNGPPTPPVQEPVVGNPAQAVDETKAPAGTAGPATGPGEQIVVTGSRIARPNLSSASPIAVVTGEQTVQSGDITLDTFLNTLPQVNPAGTTTSNNPPNGGQSNIDLRGLGPNRNLVLIDGRRPMVSQANMAVDLNTIPQGLIERIEVITGGAGATYGADAIAGVANIILKDNFTGFELRGGYSNSIPEMDSREYQISGTMGASFDDGRGNVAVSAEYSQREGTVKGQRDFARQATSTTGTPPVGKLVENSGDPISQAAINAVFAKYGVSAANAPTAGLSLIHFNSDGTLFSGGIFNSPVDVQNYRYDPKGLDAAAANQNYFPDFYSYNFDAINLLTLPLKRKSVYARGNYEIDPHAEVFFQGGFTDYTSATALAPTPVGTRIYRNAPKPVYASSNLICGATTTAADGCGPTTGASTFVTNSIVPITNPFIPADLKTLLASRTGNDLTLVGSGPTEPIRLAIRSLNTGLRQQGYRNQVLQGLFGLRGEIIPGWRYEAYYSYGRTVIDTSSTGNVDVNKLQTLLEASDGGKSICPGGYNPFGIQPLSSECTAYIESSATSKTTFTQKIAQGYITGDLFDLPGGTVKAVLGLENRRFTFLYEPGALSGAIAGFNTSDPAHGTNSFMDYFAELNLPLLKDAPFAQELNVDLGYRSSRSDFNDIQNKIDGKPRTDSAWKIDVSWKPLNALRFRGSYQKSVRAPNFGELFSSGSSFVTAFDPCSNGTNYRTAGGAAAAAFCTATGVANPATFAATPGLQVNTGISGNPNLKPEKGTTITAGAVFQAFGLVGSLDYYNIKIKNKIFGPDTNMLIAACYGYVPGIAASTTSPYCKSVVRSGSNISFIAVQPQIGGDSTSNFLTINRGIVKTSGVDFQLSYKVPMGFLGSGARLNLDLLTNYLIEFKNEELPGAIYDYAGTVSYFGEGLGQSFPRWKATLNAALVVSPFTFSTRLRYIDKMKNRSLVQFPGETAQTFSGVPSVVYVDVAAQADITRNLSLRIGLNNALDKQPPVYAPNVQSGTDPSLYDVIGRRAYVQARVKF